MEPIDICGGGSLHITLFRKGGKGGTAVGLLGKLGADAGSGQGVCDEVVISEQESRL